MVLPISGPFNSRKSVSTQTDSFSAVVWKQAKPIDRPLNYSMSGQNLMSMIVGDVNMFGPPSNYSVASLWTPQIRQDLENRAYESLKGKISSSAELGASLAELPQSYAMIAKRTEQLLRFTRAVKKFDFVAAQGILKMAIVPPKVSRRKGFADNWLEYSFGWRPLIGDIYNAVDVLQNPIKSIRPKGSANETLILSEESGSKTSGFYEERRINGRAWCKMGMEVTVTNPNLFLANNLGLLNPVSVAWELVPFSFVVDWFANVGQVIDSMSDFAGLSMRNAYTTHFATGTYLVSAWNPFWVSTRNTGIYRSGEMYRKDSLSGPSLSIRPWKIPGVGRAANMLGVLTQTLSRR